MRVPILPAAPSWYPGHMASFMNMLPGMLNRTDIVLEVRDSRLPLTSINPNFEFHISNWKGKTKEATVGGNPVGRNRVIVMNKCDLVSDWGIKPYSSAHASIYPGSNLQFVNSRNHSSMKKFLGSILSFAKANNPNGETSVLVMGMPNVGKSTLLNQLRSIGIPGSARKPLLVSPFPGKTLCVSTRLKLFENPRVYACDTPGVMEPFLGKGRFAAERALKLCLIATIKDALYDFELLAEWLLYRLYTQHPEAPAYMGLLPNFKNPDIEIEEFLERLALRLGMLRPGGGADHRRSAYWFLKWWREHGIKKKEGKHKAGYPPMSRALGWGLDFDWSAQMQEPSLTQGISREDPLTRTTIEEKMKQSIIQHAEQMKAEVDSGNFLSEHQKRKRLTEEHFASMAARQSIREKGGKLPKVPPPEW